MSAATVEEIYEQQIKPLPIHERLRLLALVARDLADASISTERPKRDVMEFYGVGRDSWDGTDAQEYVNSLRSEWDHRP